MMSLRRSVEQILPYMNDSQSDVTDLAGFAQTLVRRKVWIRSMLSQLKVLLLDAPAVSCPCKLVLISNSRIPTIRAGIIGTM